VSGFAEEAEAVLRRFPQTRLMVFPELHLCGIDEAEDADRQLQEAAEPLDGRRVAELGSIARDLGVWLLPGSMCERGPEGELFNTAPAFSPDGKLAASYRKVFPWRPREPYDPGDRFVVFDIPGTGRVGFSICYDRAQELVLARANAIVNQVFVVSVNTAGPVGTGRSLVVDPEGLVRTEAPGEGATVLTDVLDLDHVTRARTYGTAGLSRMWAQFTEADTPIDLPLYGGRIDPRRWHPGQGGPAPS
jgi:predicted amidohydrolase